MDLSRRLHTALLCLIAALISATPAFATETRAQFDARITEQLLQIAPDAVEPFNRANSAREHGDHQGAIAAYATVRQIAPTFSHAARRQCGEYAAAQRLPEAIEACRAAVASEASADNLAALATVLAQRPDGANDPEVDSLMVRARELGRDTLGVLLADGDIAMRRHDLTGLQSAADRLLVVAPGDPSGLSMGFVAALADGRFDDARRLTDRFCAAGFDQAHCTAMRRFETENTPWWFKAWRIARWLIPAWIGISLALFFLGGVLSTLTLRASRQLPKEASGRAVGIDSRLRTAYRTVLWLCCLYYYASLPLVLALVVVGGAGFVVACFAVGHIPVKLVMIVMLVVLATVWALLKSLFVRVKDLDPGTRLDLARYPRLRAVLDEVAEKAGTHPVDAVYLTPFEDVAVFERTTMWKNAPRCGIRCAALEANAVWYSGSGYSMACDCSRSKPCWPTNMGTFVMRTPPAAASHSWSAVH